MRTLQIALQGLRGAPIRSLLSVVTLTLGMLGLVAVISATGVMRDAMTQKALLAGGHENTVEVTVSNETAPLEEANDIATRVALRTGADASAVSVTNEEIFVWEHGTIVDLAGVTFTTASLRSIMPYPVIRGTWLDDETQALAPRVVFNEVANEAFTELSELKIGTQETRMRVVPRGVVNDSEDVPHVYLQLADYQKFASAPVSYRVLLHGDRLSEDEVTSATKTLAAMGDNVAVSGVKRTDIVSQFGAEVSTTTQVFLVLGLLGLVSTVAGILNIGLSTAKARSSEFALRRTLGASRARIAMIVVMESQILAIAAAAVAFAASYLLFPIVVGSFGKQLGVAPPPYSAWYGLVCLVLASLTALLSSLVPAVLSYRRDLSEVMRI